MLELGGEAALVSIARRSGRSTLQHLDLAKALDSERTILKNICGSAAIFNNALRTTRST
jgi:hypothetical protein